MMNFDRELLWQYAEDYVQGKLNADTIYHLTQFINSDRQLQQEWDEHVETLKILNEMSRQHALKSKILNVHNQFVSSSDKSLTQKRSIFFSPKYLLWARNAAVIIIIIFSSSFLTSQFFISDNNNEQQNEFISLKRDIQNIKHSQEQLKLSIDNKQQKEQPVIDNQNIAGTGFAITNDGYLVTDYHVIDKADSIYIKINTDEYKKAYLVGFDINSDIAILKILDDKYKFSKTDLPYHLLNSQSPVAQSIFSIGYPQDNVFYTEGYISSHSGVDGSKVQYQLELPAHPGQSGSPIFDNNGEVIGMLLGKKTYATYAVKSSSILELVRTLPKEHKIRLSNKSSLKGIGRTEQVKKANEYVFPVLVFKS